jgi:arylsulfatase
LRRDPFERADHSSNTYWDWYIQHAYAIYAMQAIVAEQIEAYKQYPPRQKPAAFNLDEVLRKIQEAGASANH